MSVQEKDCLKASLLSICKGSGAHASIPTERWDGDHCSAWHTSRELDESGTTPPLLHHHHHHHHQMPTSSPLEWTPDGDVPQRFGAIKRAPMFSFLTPVGCVFRSLPVQLLFLLLFTFHVYLTVYGCATRSGEVIPFHTVIGFIFVGEHVMMITTEKRNYRRSSIRRSAITYIDVCVLLALALETVMLVVWCVTRSALTIYTALPISPLIIFPRFRQFGVSLRRCVSSDRRRYQVDGFDLDLTFIDRTVVAMSWPAQNFERLFRNPADEVEKLLDVTYGPQKYHVFNLCAERGYAHPALFHGNVSHYPMDDHNPAELDVMLSFAQESWNFLRRDPERRAIAVHCKGGKGRTGTMVCAYLMYSGLVATADLALQHFGRTRTALGGRFQGVQTPSQERYVRYFERVLSLMRAPSTTAANPWQRKQITQIILFDIPLLWWKSGISKLWFVIIVKPCTERRVVYLSKLGVAFKIGQPADSRGRMWAELHNASVPPDESNHSESQQMDQSAHGCAYDDEFVVHVQDRSTGRERIVDQHGENMPLGNSNTRVTLEAMGLEKIPPLEGDVVIKLYFAETRPDPLKPPVQFWFNTAMEGEELRLGKSQLDGPHRDAEGKHYPDGFTVILRMQNI